MTVARSVARAVASPVARAVVGEIGGGLTFSQVVADAVGYWPLQDDAANTVVDDANSANNGTLIGTTTATISVDDGPTSLLTKSLDFSGASQSISLPSAITAACSGDFSWSWWYDFTQSNTGNDGFLNVGTNSSSTNNHLVVYVNSTQVVAQTRGTSAATQPVSRPGSGWHLVTVILDRSNLLLKLFIDGTKAQRSVTAAQLPTLPDTASSLAIVQGLGWVEGKMAGAGVWNRVLTDSEVSLLAGV